MNMVTIMIFLIWRFSKKIKYTIKSYKFFISILDNLLLILKSLHSTFASWLYTTLYLPFHLLTSSTLPSSSSSSSSSIHSSLSLSLFLYLSFQCLIFSIPNHYLFHFLPLLLLLLLFQKDSIYQLFQQVFSRIIKGKTR